MTAAHRIAPATAEDRERVYAIRHEVYAREIGQHPENGDGRLTDALDDVNDYLVARQCGQVVGFVSLTPPGAGRLSIEKYVARAELPFAVDDGLWEVRLLTVVGERRRGTATVALMQAAFEAVVRAGGTRVVVMGRRELLPLYARVGLRPVGLAIRSGSVDFEVLRVTTAEAQRLLPGLQRVLDRVAEHVGATQDGGPPDGAVGCFHGGASIAAAGPDLADQRAHEGVVTADVLDAWFPPAPAVLEVLQQRFAWSARTSPPADCAPFLAAVAAARGLDAAHLLPGAGSSALVFLALGRWLTARSRVLLLDPTYGEYDHVLTRVIGARVDRLQVSRGRSYDLDLDELARRAPAHDLVVLINPNSPTGRHVPRDRLEAVLRSLPSRTRVWVDETYAAYAGPDASLASFAAASDNVVVCTSMSKAYALSGLRVAYLCGPVDVIAGLRTWTPPWAVSLPGQLAAIAALSSHDYYTASWSRTHELRGQLADALRTVPGVQVVPGVANFLLCHLPPDGPTASTVVSRCQAEGVYLRDAEAMGSALGDRALRVAVRGKADDARTVATLRHALA